MPAYRKASIRDLTQAAANIDGRFVQGVVHQDPEKGVWMIGGTALDEWLDLHKGEEVHVDPAIDGGRPPVGKANLQDLRTRLLRI
jgi:hypothetical protein